MAVFKIINMNKKANQSSYIAEKINYIMQPHKIAHNFYGGYGFLMGNTENIISQFYAVRYLLCKEKGIQLRHMILSFSDEFENVTPYQASKIAQEICGFFYPEYQIIYAVHEDTNNIHIHFLINTVNVYTGNLLNMDKRLFYNLMTEITIILQIYGSRYFRHPIKLIGYEFVDDRL